jgi:CheY-like chemotaxis protein
MKMMNVLVVDDEIDDVQLLIEGLRSTGLCDVTYERSYLNLGADDHAILRHVSSYDLLLLDILVGASTQEFQRVVSAVGGAKPFIAYTQYPDTHVLESYDSFDEIRQIVLTHGGLGVITKSYYQFQSNEKKSHPNVI